MRLTNTYSVLLFMYLIQNEYWPGITKRQINIFCLPPPGSSEAIAAWLFYDETAVSGGGLREWAIGTQTVFLHKQQDEMWKLAEIWHPYLEHSPTQRASSPALKSRSLSKPHVSRSSELIEPITYARSKINRANCIGAS